MRRAILVTTGTVVGVASVIAYNPSQRLAVSGLTVTALTPASATTATTATQASTATPAPAQTTAATTTTTAAKPATKHKAKAHKRATATTKKRATGTTKKRATATATPKPVATAAGPFANADGTFHSSTQQVVSHGRYYGDATVSVTVRAGHITNIQFNETGGNFQFADAIQQYLVPEIIKQQKVSVGIVSGATGSSMALINGLNSVLKKA